MVTEILGGFLALGGAIYKSAKAKTRREEERAKLKKQMENLKMIKQYKNDIYKLQTKSVADQFDQQKKAINLAQNVTKENQQSALVNSANAAVQNNKMFANQMNQASMQAAEAIGMATQAASTSGFRTVGSSKGDDGYHSNIERSQAKRNAMTLSGLQSQIDMRKQEQILQASNAYAQSNMQIAQNNQNLLAGQQNMNNQLAVMAKNNELDNYQMDTQLADMQSAHDYLNNYWNFIGDDIMNISSTVLGSALNIAGAVEQENLMDKKIEDALEDASKGYEWQDSMDAIERHNERVAAGLANPISTSIGMTMSLNPDINVSSPATDFFSSNSISNILDVQKTFNTKKKKGFTFEYQGV